MDQKDSSSPSQQLEAVWNHVIQHNDTCPVEKEKQWPHYKAILDDITNADYTEVLTCPHDIAQKSRKTTKFFGSIQKNDNEEKMSKAFCAHGAVVCAKIEMFERKVGYDEKNYTGLLCPGETVDNCIIRFSTAMKPPATESNPFGRYFLKATGGKLKHAVLFPMLAIKAFRRDNRSGNLLFAGPKIGQKTDNFFEQSLCTQMTERVPPLIQPFIKKFYSYSDHPLSLGISDFCRVDQNGNETSLTDLEFPYVLILKPVYEKQGSNKNDDDSEVDGKRFDNFIDDLLTIPPNSTLFDIYTCPDPSSTLDPSLIQRIGRISTTSEMILSHPNDGLFFRHQKKEEDFDLRPDWLEEVNATCVTKCGNVEGTVGRLVGSTFLESCIKENKYIDFEQE